MVTVAFATAAPDGSSTVPSMVPALPRDWQSAEPAQSNRHAPMTEASFIIFDFERPEVWRPKKIPQVASLWR
jgi:hypothetical protein